MQRYSSRSKKFFLLVFTKELIKNSYTGSEQGTEELQQIIKKETTAKAHDIIEESKPLKIEKEEPKKEEHFEINFPRKIVRPVSIPRVLRIPEPSLPPTFQYLKPSPTQKELDLDRLNPLIKDPFVKIIECNGPDEQIIVQGAMGRKLTNTMLSKEEIDGIINKFSKEANIPVQTGMYKAIVGRLNLSAIISNTIGSKFIIKKMLYNPAGFVRQNPQQSR